MPNPAQVVRELAKDETLRMMLGAFGALWAMAFATAWVASVATTWVETREREAAAVAAAPPAGMVSGWLRIVDVRVGADGVEDAVATISNAGQLYRVELVGAMAKDVLAQSGRNLFGSPITLRATVSVDPGGKVSSVTVVRD